MVNNVTTNIGLILPNFDQKTWHDDFYSNMKTIDAVLDFYLQISNLKGAWQNSFSYVVGDRAVDGDGGVIYECQVAHTSAAAPSTFSADRTNNPTYWASFSLSFQNVGDWAASTAYAPGEFVVNGTKTFIVQTQHTSNSSGNISNDVSLGYLHELLDASLVGNVTGDVEGNNYTISNITLNHYREKFTEYNNVSGTYDITLGNSQTHKFNLNGNTTLTFNTTGMVANATISNTFIFVQNSSGGSEITWPAEVLWENDDAVNISTGADNQTVVTMFTTDGGSNFYGFLSGVNMT